MTYQNKNLLVVASELDYIDKHPFAAVELHLNKSSIRTSLFTKWAAQTPEEFMFVIHTTMDQPLLGAALRRAQLLGNKVGPVVITIPRGEPYHYGKLAAIIDELPTYRYALDLKSTAWHCRDAYQEMEQLDIPVLRSSLEQDGPVTSWRIFKMSVDDIEANSNELKAQPTVVIARSEPTRHQRLWQIMKDLGLDKPLTGLKPAAPGPSNPDTGPNNATETVPEDDYRREYPKVKKPYNAVEDSENEAEKEFSGTDEPLHMTYPKTFDSEGIGSTDGKIDLGYGAKPSKKKKLY